MIGLQHSNPAAGKRCENTEIQTMPVDQPRKLVVMFLVAVLLSACQFTYDGERPVSDLYCDSFLVYDMCATDTNRDGVVDLVYFSDDMQVFMYREGADRRIPRHLRRHRCAVLMDEDLVATTSRLFFIDEETSAIEKTDIRGAMLLKYIAYMPEVSACNRRFEEAEAAAADEGEGAI